MDAVTYPHEAVVSAIDRGFSPYKINMLERHPDFKEACAGGRVLWGPTFVIADHRGSEVRRWCGWLPPEDFLAELAFCHALGQYTHGKFAEAAAGLDAIVQNNGETQIHPEALYWHGAAGFIAGGKDWAVLRKSWKRLAKEYPGHRFGVHASVIEDAPE